MTNQEIICYLKQYKYLDNNINRQLKEKEEWKARAEKVTTVITGMPHGSSGENSRENAICKMIECDNITNKMIDEYIDMGVKIKSQLDQLEDEKQSSLLEKVYMKGVKLKDIATEMDYSFKRISRHHDKAIEKLSIILNYNIKT